MATRTMLQNQGPRLRRDGSTTSSLSSVSSGSRRSRYALVLVLSSLNKTFDRKSLVLPFFPEVLKLGRQTNPKTAPAPDNGYFDSRVLSRQHAEVWADRDTSKVFIRDAKSSNGTYLNGSRLSSDNTESRPHELKKNDVLELGIDITNDDGSSLVHRKISARVDQISVMALDVGPAASPSSLSSAGSSSNVLASTSSASSSTATLPIELAPRIKPDSLDVALFGDVDASLEDLIMGHARKSTGGLFMYAGAANSTQFEAVVKRLAGEIHAARVEAARLDSVASLLKQIAASQQKSSVLAKLVEQLTAKDTYINHLVKEADTAYHEARRLRKELEQLKEQVDKNSSLSEANLKLNGFKTDHQSSLDDNLNGYEQSLLAQTAAKAAALQEKSDSDLGSSNGRSHSNGQTTPAPSDPSTPQTPELSELATLQAQLDDARRQLAAMKTPGPYASSRATALPVTSAVGVVLVGIGIMTFINVLSRER